MEATSADLLTQKGLTTWPTAAPIGLAKLIIAVAVTRPELVNHVSENRVGALRTSDCAMPSRAWPTATTATLLLVEEEDPAYRIQLPIMSKLLPVMMVGRSPQSSNRIVTNVMAKLAKTKMLLSQFMVDSSTR